jgi:2-formylbenzoate dehydrogenase
MAAANAVQPDTTRSREVAARVAEHPWAIRIAGEQIAGDPAGWATTNPSTGEHLATVPAATPADVDAAVRAGQAAFEQWRTVAPRERAKRIRAWADLIAAHADELAELDAVDAGLPMHAGRFDVASAVESMHLTADWAMELKGSTIPATADHLHYTVREPFGVVARIIAYNHPLMFATRAATPLVAGNACILKTPDQAPLSGLRLAELAADVLPPGLLTVLAGSGAVVGDAMARHPAIRRLAFTGSVRTGLAIQGAAAASGVVKSISLELGGKNPLIVFPDADLQEAARWAMIGMNLTMTSGQSCGSTSRLLVHESVAEQIVDRIRAAFQALTIGDPLADGTQMGPVISDTHRDRVLAHIHSARDSGATILAGGGPPEGLDRGWFLAPTLITDVRQDMPIANNEVFGPVLSVVTWRDEQEALAIANAVEYGLTASIFTRDLARAHRLARRVDAGFVWFNETAAHYPGVPFGGFKNSGVGREEDLSEVLSFTQVKTVNVPIGS